MLRFHVLALGLLILLQSLELAAASVRHRSGFAEVIQEYEKALIQLALEATRDHWGAYHYTLLPKPISANRLLLELDHGHLFDVSFNTAPVEARDYPNIEVFALPEKRNLLGLRQFIVRTDDRKVFEQLDTRKDFLQLRPGLPQNWSDFAIFQHNSVQVVAASRFDVIYSMLAGNRFDYIPLGFLEIEPTFALIADKYQSLVVSEGAYIYYPLHLNVLISKKNPELAQRLGSGLEIVFSSGEEEALFNRLFGWKLQELEDSSAKIFVLENPNYLPRQNRRITQTFLEHYEFQNQAVYVNKND